MFSKIVTLYSELYFYHEIILIFTSLVYVSLILFQWISMKLKLNVAIIQVSSFLLFFFAIIFRFHCLLKCFYFIHLIYIPILILILILTFSINTQFIWDELNQSKLQQILVAALIFISIFQAYFLRKYIHQINDLKNSELIKTSLNDQTTTTAVSNISSKVENLSSEFDEIQETAVLNISPPIPQEINLNLIQIVSDYSYRLPPSLSNLNHVSGLD